MALERIRNDWALTRQSVTLLRVLGLFMALVVPAFRWVLPADAVDPLWCRLVFSGFCLVTVGASFFSEMVVRRAMVFSYIFCFLLTSWILVLTYLNELRTAYVISYFLMLFTSIILVRDWRWLVGFVVVNLVAVLAIAATGVSGEIPTGQFLAFSLSIFSISTAAQSAGLWEFEATVRKNENLRSLTDAAMSNAAEGIMVTNASGVIIDHNSAFCKLTGSENKEKKGLPLDTWLQWLQPHLQSPSKVTEWMQLAGPQMTTIIDDTYALKDGRYLTLHSAPIMKDKDQLGRMWFITDTTLAENQKASLEQQGLRLRRQNELLHRLSTDRAIQSGDLESTAPIVVSEVALAMGADKASIWRLSDDGQHLRCLSAIHVATGLYETKADIVRGQDAGLLELMASERVATLGTAPIRPDSAPAGTLVPGHWLLAPLRHEGVPFGLLALQRTTDRQPWHSDDPQWLASIGDLLAIAAASASRRAVESKLANTAALIQAVFESAGVGILVTHNNRSVLDCNNTYLSIFGLTRDFVLNSPPEAVVEACREKLLDSSSASQAMTSILSNPDQTHYQTQLFKDGRIVERFTEVLRVDQQIVGRVWFYTDVTARSKAEQELRKAEERNRATLHAVPDLMLRTTAQGQILDLKVPEKWELAHLLHPDAQDIDSLFPQRLAASLSEMATAALAEQVVKQQELEIEVGQAHVDLELRVSPAGPAEVLVIVRDVTLSKLTEKELRQRNFELDSFVYRASHDLKAPLNSMMGLIDILKSESMEPAFARYLQLMDRSILKLDTFIGNLTDYSKVNRARLQPEPIDFEALVQETWEGLQYMAHVQEITLRSHVEGCENFETDRFHIGLVLANLLSNAVKYQDPQKASRYVEVDVHCAEDECQISVADNGLGIDPAYKDQIFDLFFRATNISFGSGLGLYITRNAVVKMGGTIDLNSEQGQGTKFTVHLPRITSTAAPAVGLEELDWMKN